MRTHTTFVLGTEAFGFASSVCDSTHVSIRGFVCVSLCRLISLTPSDSSGGLSSVVSASPYGLCQAGALPGASDLSW
jgi:hypothetical protein